MVSVINVGDAEEREGVFTGAGPFRATIFPFKQDGVYCRYDQELGRETATRNWLLFRAHLDPCPLYDIPIDDPRPPGRVELKIQYRLSVYRGHHQHDVSDGGSGKRNKLNLVQVSDWKTAKWIESPDVDIKNITNYNMSWKQEIASPTSGWQPNGYFLIDHASPCPCWDCKNWSYTQHEPCSSDDPDDELIGGFCLPLDPCDLEWGSLPPQNGFDRGSCEYHTPDEEISPSNIPEYGGTRVSIEFKLEWSIEDFGCDVEHSPTDPWDVLGFLDPANLGIHDQDIIGTNICCYAGQDSLKRPYQQGLLPDPVGVPAIVIWDSNPEFPTGGIFHHIVEDCSIENVHWVGGNMCSRGCVCNLGDESRFYYAWDSGDPLVMVVWEGNIVWTIPEHNKHRRRRTTRDVRKYNQKERRTEKSSDDLPGGAYFPCPNCDCCRDLINQALRDLQLELCNLTSRDDPCHEAMRCCIDSNFDPEGLGPGEYGGLGCCSAGVCNKTPGREWGHNACDWSRNYKEQMSQMFLTTDPWQQCCKKQYDSDGNLVCDPRERARKIIESIFGKSAKHPFPNELWECVEMLKKNEPQIPPFRPSSVPGVLERWQEENPCCPDPPDMVPSPLNPSKSVSLERTTYVWEGGEKTEKYLSSSSINFMKEQKARSEDPDSGDQVCENLDWYHTIITVKGAIGYNGRTDMPHGPGPFGQSKVSVYGELRTRVPSVVALPSDPCCRMEGCQDLAIISPIQVRTTGLCPDIGQYSWFGEPSPRADSGWATFYSNVGGNAMPFITPPMEIPSGAGGTLQLHVTAGCPIIDCCHSFDAVKVEPYRRDIRCLSNGDDKLNPDPRINSGRPIPYDYNCFGCCQPNILCEGNECRTPPDYGDCPGSETYSACCPPPEYPGEDNDYMLITLRVSFNDTVIGPHR